MNSLEKSSYCLECGYYPLTLSLKDDDRCPKCLNIDPFGKKAERKKRNRVVGSIILITAFFISVFYLIPFLEIQYNKITQNGKTPVHFLPFQNKAPN